jgi:hypothetical protein
MIKQEMKYYILHSINLQIMFSKRRNYLNSGKFLLLKLFIRRITTQTVQFMSHVAVINTHNFIQHCAITVNFILHNIMESSVLISP